MECYPKEAFDSLTIVEIKEVCALAIRCLTSLNRRAYNAEKKLMFKTLSFQSWKKVYINNEDVLDYDNMNIKIMWVYEHVQKNGQNIIETLNEK